MPGERTKMRRQEVGKILELFISVKDEEGKTNTISQKEIALDSKGVLGDKFYAKDLQRSILISSYESYKIAKENNLDMPYGSLGENILMDYDPYYLHLGDQLKVGDLVLEITQDCTLCKGLSKVDASAPKLLKDHRGIFAKTVTDGSIKIGDPVYI